MRERSQKVLILALVVAGLGVIDVALTVRVFRPRLLDVDLYAGVSDRTAPFTTDRYAAVLRRYVDDRGLVDYKALKDNPRDLNEFLRSAGGLKRKTYDTWSRKEKTAFWLNVQNALILRTVLDHYPIRPSGPRRLSYPSDSIRQVPGLRTRLLFVVMGEQVTLDEVDRRLRRRSTDPRLHMAAVPAAWSSPALRSEPYRGEELDDQLDDQVRRFLARPGNFQVDRTAGKVILSRVFDWYAGDFVKAFAPKDGFGNRPPKLKAVLNFAARYLDEDDADYLRSGSYTVEYAEFDWALNDQAAPEANGGRNPPPAASPGA